MLFQNREMAINAETLLEEKRDLEKKLREAEKSLADSKAEENKEARMRQMLGQMMTELGYNNNDAKVQADNELKNLVAELESAKSPSLDSASNTILTEMRRHHNEGMKKQKKKRIFFSFPNQGYCSNRRVQSDHLKTRGHKCRQCPQDSGPPEAKPGPGKGASRAGAKAVADRARVRKSPR